MEIIEIVGIRHVNFTDEKGKNISGVSIYFFMEADGVIGKMTGKMFLNSDRVNRLDKMPEVGQRVAVDYDRYGKPARFSPV